MKSRSAFVPSVWGLLATIALGLGVAGCESKTATPHHHSPHLGVVAPFQGEGAPNGFLELKLHDDKGDLELWLARDEGIAKPLDLPIDTVVEVEFTGKSGRKVAMRVRDPQKNPDEDGNPNIRSGKTNYFIFPSAGGEDASWLQGADFSSKVVVRFSAFEKSFESEEFVLAPHVH